MANYYYVKIESDKINQEVAAKILSIISKTNRIRSFNFDENGHLFFNSRGLPESINSIFNNYNFSKEEIEIKDEFETYMEEE